MAGERIAPVAERSSYVQYALGLTLLFGLAAGCAIVLRPFFVAILWAAILAVSTWPIYRWLEFHAHGRRTLAALLMTLLLALLLLLPLVLLGSQLTDQVVRLLAAIREAIEHGPPAPPPWLAGLPVVGERLAEAWQTAAHNTESLRATLQEYIVPVRSWLLARGADLAEGLLQVTLSLLTAFFFYRDGPALLRVAEGVVTRITGSPARRFAQSAAATIKSVVLGLLGTCLILAILAAASYWAAGVPGALFLGFLAFFLTLLPGGMALIWAPVAIWLASKGATDWAIFIVVWNLFLAVLENVLRPYLMRQGTDLPFLVILVGVVGGAIGFGLVGVFIGPTLLGIACTLLVEWGDGTVPAKHQVPPTPLSAPAAGRA